MIFIIKFSDFLYKYIKIIATLAAIFMYLQAFKGYDVWFFCILFSELFSLATWPFSEEQKNWKNKGKFKSLFIAIITPAILLSLLYLRDK